MNQPNNLSNPISVKAMDGEFARLKREILQLEALANRVPSTKSYQFHALNHVKRLEYKFKTIYPYLNSHCVLDDRKDFFEIDDSDYWQNFFSTDASLDWNKQLTEDPCKVKDAFKSVCSLVFQKQKETLLDPKKRQDLLFHKVIQAVKNKALCAEEPHQMQAAFSWGTGFLIRPDIVITAGHNIFNYKNESYINWENLSIYFGCFLSHHSQKYPSIEEKEEYKIKKILWVTKVSNQDFAVLQLDRDAKGVPLLPLNQNKRPTRGTPIYTIGHGNSLPAKFTPGAHFVKRFNRNYFSANLDTFSGNSGSPVFNACTHEVEGILVKGLKDYELVPDGSCYTTKKYNRKHGEKVQIIGPVVQMLNHLNI